MLDIVITFVENLSPDYLAAPLMFFKAEKYPDGSLVRRGPTTEDLIQQIKKRKAESGQERVELHSYDDRDIIEMLASAPTETLMRIKDDVCMIKEEEKKSLFGLFTRKPSDDMSIATARIVTLQNAFVRLLAPNLSHRPQNDINSVYNWGLDVEHAMGRFLNGSLEQVRNNSYHQKNKAAQPIDSLKEALETQQASSLGRAFARLRWKMLDPIQQSNPQYKKLELKIIDFDARMTHAMDVLSKLEESCKDDIQAGKGRIKGYENTQETISKFYELLETYHDTLDGQSSRLRHDEAEAFQSGGDPSDKLRAKFRDISLTIKNDIADRLHGLRKTMHVCEIEYGAYQTMIAAEKNSWESIEHLIRDQIPLFRQQLMQAQNIKAGRVAVQMDNVSGKLQKLSGQKLRDAAAEQIIDGVCEEIKAAAHTLDDIAETEIRAITKAETLMIEDQRPVALIENKSHEIEPAV